MLIFGILVMGQIVRVQFVQGAELQAEADELVLDLRTIEAPRGNIYADNERKTSLALSVPRYEIRMDLMTVSDEIFDENVGALSDSLALIFPRKSAQGWEEDLNREKYTDSNQYYRIESDVRNEQLERLANFPIFNLGKYKGGYIELQENDRVNPYEPLANRTIGYVRYLDTNETYHGRKDTIRVGLEGYFDDYLAGQNGEMLMKKIGAGLWKPVKSEYSKDPIPGKDLYTSIDIDLQDVAERALLQQLENQDALRGCVVLMEVETGFVKAIANLSKDTVYGGYSESQNLAVGMRSEPGSTFKLASLMVALDDGKIRATDSVQIRHQYPYFDRVLKDDHAIPGTYSMQYAFEKSSNVISKVIYDSYRANPQEFIDGLKEIGLDKKLGVDIKGEAVPYIKDADDEDFWGTSLPWMAIGYEELLTPLQTLALYNAVANKGVMVKPQFVKEIRDGDEVVKKFEPIVLNQQVCSMPTRLTLQKFLEGVVERGTAKNIKARGFKIAGKTGTAKIAQSGSYGNKYQASFCGYFPADNPKYSCIVVIQGPTRQIYGSVVSGTVFKEIADKVYAGGLENSPEPDYNLAEMSLPYSKHGDKSELELVMAKMKLPIKRNDNDSEWVLTRTGREHVEFEQRLVQNGQVPNVLGMGLQDALYLLESQGLIVRIKGSGIVKNQSIMPGREVNNGQVITIELI